MAEATSANSDAIRKTNIPDPMPEESRDCLSRLEYLRETWRLSPPPPRNSWSVLMNGVMPMPRPPAPVVYPFIR